MVDFRGVDRQIPAEGFAKSRAADDFAYDALFTGFSFIWTLGHDLERICWLCELNGIPQHRIRHEGHAIVLDQTCDRHGVHNIGRRLRARDIRRDGVRPLGVAAALGAGDDLEHSRSVSGFGRWTASAILLSLAIDFINFVLPNAKRPSLLPLSPGTIFVVLTLVLSSFGFNLYFQYFASYPRIYGAIGGFIVLMLWIYLASVILLVGAETDSEIEASASRWGGQ